MSVSDALKYDFSFLLIDIYYMSECAADNKNLFSKYALIVPRNCLLYHNCRVNNYCVALFLARKKRPFGRFCFVISYVHSEHNVYLFTYFVASSRESPYDSISSFMISSSEKLCFLNDDTKIFMELILSSATAFSITSHILMSSHVDYCRILLFPPLIDCWFAQACISNTVCFPASRMCSLPLSNNVSFWLATTSITPVFIIINFITNIVH